MRVRVVTEAAERAATEMIAWMIAVPVVVLIVALWLLWMPVGMVVDEVAARRRWRATRKGIS